MKQLLLLTFMAVASEAMAQDAQCVPERAAMVEIIRGYVRSDASLWVRKPYQSASWRLWSERNAIGSSPGGLAR
jgi:hypothetical protein